MLFINKNRAMDNVQKVNNCSSNRMDLSDLLGKTWREMSLGCVNDGLIAGNPQQLVTQN
jgi:hypothetical protein